ncbi:MAG TPA: tyrosine protein kinase, partial [Candidatus Aquabacterium excrementipullorum]|nr:tyrosine protein kinase [Candidatus Aquabacterium excrementipullorum]
MSSPFSPSRLGPLDEAAEFQNTQPPPPEKSIGELISEANNLSSEQIEQILVYQRDNGVRFGEAA